MPNPAGEDQEKEWIEIYNPTTATAILEGYFLADGDSDTWSDSAWAIPKNSLVPPAGVLAIMLPKDSLTLNNSGKEKVKLFSSQKQLLDLEGAVLEIVTRKKTFEKGVKIKSNSFFTIYEDNSSARLSNSGQTLKLFDAFGREVANVKYGEAEAGMAYASLDGHTYAWTSSPTPGKQNEMVLGVEASAAGEAESASSPSGSKTKSAPGITSAQAKQILALNKDVKSLLALMQGSIVGLEAKLDSRASATETADRNPIVQNQASSKTSGGLPAAVIFIPGILFLAGIIFVIFKYVKL